MANDDPVDLGVLELLNADLTGEGTVGLVEDILGGDANLGVGEAAGEGEVQGWRGDNDLSGGVELGGIEVVDDTGDALGNTVPTFWSIALSGRRGSIAARERPIEGPRGSGSMVTYILKLPPTKNWRGIMIGYCSEYIWKVRRNVREKMGREREGGRLREIHGWRGTPYPTDRRWPDSQGIDDIIGLHRGSIADVQN